MDGELLTKNLLAPAVLAFMVGVLARLAKSDLRFPEAISQGMAIYLLFAIGLKGGTALAAQPLGGVVLPGLATIVLGCAIALSAFGLARWLLQLQRGDAGAMAAHYGSTSAVTFLAAAAYLSERGASYEPFMPALLAVMEIPGIAVALACAGGGKAGPAIREAIVGKSIILLIGGLVVGYIAHREGIAKIQSFFVDPFVGILCLFLLDLGTVAAEHLKNLQVGWWRMLIYAIGLPLMNGTVGAAVGALAGLSAGGATLLAVLCASASYIAAPAAVRASLPQVDIGRCLAASLGMTFPFNLAIGIPLYHVIASWCWRLLHPLSA